MTGQSQFAGVWCPSITPMDNDGRLDLNGLSQHLKRLTEAKIDVILLMGSIGESASFTFEERLHLIRKVRAMSSLKMVANVSSTSQNDVLLMAKEAFKQSDLAALRDIQDQIGTYMSLYAIGEDFVTTIKTMVSRKFGYCSGVDNPAKNPASPPCSGRMREAIAATTHATRILVITNVPDLRSTVLVALRLIDAPMQKNQTARMGTVPVIIPLVNEPKYFPASGEKV
ncbi:dihydrodipicolinate synthase [Salmonella enterica subsp. houtenae]|nr:dihydrodipicolinate synthase [Salmonella enterica subsp. houtenae]